jgi:hypothetical protein
MAFFAGQKPTIYFFLDNLKETKKLAKKFNLDQEN